MAGFVSYDDIIQELTVNGKVFEWHFMKVGSAPEAAGVWHSLWTAVGSPGVGAAPATTPGTAYNDAAGSMNWTAVSPDQKHLLTFGATATQNCTLMLYDRLVGVSGISTASTGAKTVNSTTLPRYSGTDAKDVQCWLEVTTATTTTAPVVNLNQYTNEAGTTGRSGGSLTFPAAATNLDALVGPMPLQVGDKGIRSVEVGLNVGTASNAGVVNVLLIRPLAYLPIIANIWNEVDLVMQLTSLQRVLDTASLMIGQLAVGGTATTIWGRVKGGYG